MLINSIKDVWTSIEKGDERGAAYLQAFGVLKFLLSGFFCLVLFLKEEGEDKKSKNSRST